MLIARLTAQLRCSVPESVDETWGRLRHLGPREYVVDRTGLAGSVQRDWSWRGHGQDGRGYEVSPSPLSASTARRWC